MLLLSETHHQDKTSSSWRVDPVFIVDTDAGRSVLCQSRFWSILLRFKTESFSSNSVEWRFQGKKQGEDFDDEIRPDPFSTMHWQRLGFDGISNIS